jgi:hypothetical protein
MAVSKTKIKANLQLKFGVVARFSIMIQAWQHRSGCHSHNLHRIPNVQVATGWQYVCMYSFTCWVALSFGSNSAN